MIIQPPERNQFLAELDAPEFELLRSHLAPFELRVGKRLYYGGDPVDEVIFPHSGIVAWTMPLREGDGAAVLLVGREGIIGGHAGGAPSNCDAEVHIAGEASRMPASAFRSALEQSPALRRIAARYDGMMMAQAQQTALCNAAHSVEARVCRWLLEIHDRVDNGRIPLTQSTLAQMLGVRRTTVTLVAGRLEAADVLDCRRGILHIQNRDKLVQRSCECYGHLRAHVGRMEQMAAGEDAPRKQPTLKVG